MNLEEKLLERVLNYSPNLEVINENYESDLVSDMNKNIKKWRARSEKCFKSLVIAATYNQVALDSLENRDPLMIPLITSYYSMFHLSVANLSYAHNLSLGEITHSKGNKLTHRKVQRGVMSHLIKKKLLKNNYYNDLMSLQKARESANYKLELNLDTDLEDYMTRIQEHFESSISFLRNVEKVYKENVKGEVSKRFITVEEWINEDMFDNGSYEVGATNESYVVNRFLNDFFVSNDKKTDILMYLDRMFL